MSESIKTLSKEDVIQNKKDAIRSLNKLLETFINDSENSHLKKANLISYWIKDYVKMIGFEEKFEPKKNIAYKRGNIVKISFGFNIGSEYGGLHYGIVLDKHNSHSSPVVTVIPLTSAKANHSIHPNNVDLGNEVYRLLKLKHDTISKSVKDEREEIRKELSLFQAIVDLGTQSVDSLQLYERNSREFDEQFGNAKKYLEEAKKLEKKWKEKDRHMKEQQAILDKIGNEITGMKEGSIALISQITTVSKIRIFDPKTAKGVLAGISISEENMEKINQKIKELYIF